MAPGFGFILFLFMHISDAEKSMAFGFVQIFLRYHILAIQVFKRIYVALIIFNRYLAAFI